MSKENEIFTENKKDIIKPTFKDNNPIKRVQTAGYEYDQTMLSQMRPNENDSSTLGNTTTPLSNSGSTPLKLNFQAKSFVPKGLSSINPPNSTTNSSVLSTKTSYNMNYDTNKQINEYPLKTQFSQGIPYNPVMSSNYGGNQNKFFSTNSIQQSLTTNQVFTTTPQHQSYNTLQTFKSPVQVQTPTITNKVTLNPNSQSYIPKSKLVAATVNTQSEPTTPTPTTTPILQQIKITKDEKFLLEQPKEAESSTVNAKAAVTEPVVEVKKKSKLHGYFDQKDQIPETEVIIKNDVSKKQSSKENKEKMDKAAFHNAKKIVEETEKYVREKQEKERQEREKLERERQEKERQERERLEKEKEKEEKPIIERSYFLVRPNKPKNMFSMSIEYMKKFKDLTICKKDDLLSDECKKHLNALKTKEEDKVALRMKDRYNKQRIEKNTERIEKREPPKEDPKSVITRKTKQDIPITTTNPVASTSEPQGSNLSKWGRRDLSKYIDEAERQRTELLNARNEDPLKDQLINLLNLITVDIYDQIKNDIFEIVKDDVAKQSKLLDVLFNKALTEKYYINLYAKLCKDLDKDLPQKIEVKNGVQSSQFRKNLLEKSKQIFSFSTFDNNFEELDKEQKLANMKKHVIGNVFFITELLQTKVVSKQVADQCLNSLFQRLDKEEEETDPEYRKHKMLLYIEGIIIILDRFGTFINKLEKNIKQEILKEQNDKIDMFINRINKFVEDRSSTLPGHIQYKVINLIEKKKRGWELSEVDKIQKAKGLKEIEEQRIMEMEKLNSQTGSGFEAVSQEEMNSQVKLEIVQYREYKKVNKSEKPFGWEIATSLWNRGAHLYQFLIAINEISVDYVNNIDVAVCVYSYFYDVLSYYIRKETSEGREKLKSSILEILQNLNDCMLDNKLLSIVIGQIFFTLTIEKYNVVKVSDLDSVDFDEEQVRGLFEAAKCILYTNKNDKIDSYQAFKDQFMALKIVEKHKDIYDEIVKK